MINFVFLGFFLRIAGYLVAPPNDVAEKYGEMISASALKENLTVIADDVMEGRATGKRGQKMAAAFIRAHFEEAGLVAPVQGDYYQPLELYTEMAGETFIQSETVRLDNYSGIAYHGRDDSGGVVSTALVFAGYGSEADLKQVNVKGKAAVILSGVEGVNGNRGISLLRQSGAQTVIVCSPNNRTAFDLQAKQIEAANNTGDLSLTPPTPGTAGLAGHFIISASALESLLGAALPELIKLADPNKPALRKLKPVPIKYRTSRRVKVVKSENVLGYVEGSDKKDEVIVISAHYDHIGVGEQGTGDRIYNGADDDGSGTVAVMELARVYAAAKDAGHGPRRTLLFLAVAGEENGLLGSKYYTDHPVFSLHQTVANLNIDMIGRRDPAHATGEPYVYIIGADKISTTLNQISEAANQRYTQLVFDYTYNDTAHPQRLYYRSDHYNFARHNIPIIFYFDGLHEDYHRPTDEIEKIEFDLLAKRVKCIFYTAWEIANRDERIVPDKN
jgi:Zn-dependent M28 family amino/carboxypeptidase